MDPLQIFDNFKLETLDEKWSDEVWQREFVSFPEPPVEYSILLGSNDIEVFLKETCKSVKKWMIQNKNSNESSNERVEVSWQTLSALNINVKGLLAILGYLIKIGQAAGADEDSRQACLSAASLYIILLGIPGSSTFHVFHPNLYQRAIDTLKMSENLVTNKKKVTDLEALYAEDQSDTMLKSEKVTLIKGLNSILYDLITMLKTFYMKYQMRSLEMTVINLVEVAKLESDVNHFTTHNKMSDASLTTLSYNAYVALHELCESRHGKVEDTVRLIMRYFLPHLSPVYLDLPLRAASVVWDTMIHFFKNLLTSKGLEAETGMEILIQQLLLNCPDRSELRQKQATTVTKLINICQGKLFLKSIEHLVLFCFQNKVQHRIFGQEVIAKLLIELPIVTSETEKNNREKAKVILISTAFSRSLDVSSMVRGKALSIIETIVNSDKYTIGDFLNTSEKDNPFATLELLLETFETNINPLPGSSTFSSMLLDRIKDERALVRRSTIHALQSMVLHFPELLYTVIPIIGQHCRDPALSVRKEAIQTLANLLHSQPDKDIILKEFVKSVLDRIFDSESKVQEKVLEVMQILVLNNIKHYDKEISDSTQLLPWKIINEIIERKMRKNLSKICDMWVKSEVITNNLLDKIQSHITTEHEMEVWVLLSVLAQNSKLNIKKHFQNYKEILEQNTFISHLKIEVLRHTWKSMGKDYLENLNLHLFKCLCQFKISLESISISIDILHEITKYIHGFEGEEIVKSNVVDLMRFSEILINQLSDDSQNFDDSRIELCLKAMSTLGHASFLCTESVSDTTLEIVQSILLDCNSIQTSVEGIERLKAAGTVLLGQQAMRDRDIAEEVMPILGQLMCKPTSSTSLAQAGIRINAVKALADLCIRFTALVEPYLPDMCICMKDSNVMVREVIIVIFVQLLLEDYIKVKGAFFYHILTMLSDENETIRDLTIYLIKERLLAKNKTLIAQSFLRSLFHYNNCQTRHKFNDRKIRANEKDALTLPGHKNQSKRRKIYDFMLEHLDPPNKIKVLTKLNNEILEGVCEKFINIKQVEGQCILKDCFYIISNERLQASFTNKAQDDDFQDEASVAIESQTNAAVNVIVEGMKKFKLTVMLQTLIKLRQFISTSKSPLLVDISKFFIKFISDFNKDQIAEIYDDQPELKKLIDHDISIYGKKPVDSDEEDIFDNHSETEEIVIHNENQTKENIVNDGSVLKENKVHNENVTVEMSKTKDINANLSPKRKSDNSCLTTSTPKKLHNLQLNRVPRIVLRRLSTLTYPGAPQWKSPPREKAISLTSDPGPSTSSGISVSSQSSIEEFNTSSPDSFESEFSIRLTPKPKKIARSSKKTEDVQNF